MVLTVPWAQGEAWTCRDTSAESKEVPDFVKVRSALRRSGIPADELEARRSQTGRDAPTEFCKNDAFSPSATSDTAKGSDLTKVFCPKDLELLLCKEIYQDAAT